MDLRSIFSSSETFSNERARQLAMEQREQQYRRTDRLFADLLAFEYFAGIAAALWISPLAWAGADRQLHPHVWSAALLGLLIVSFPIWLARFHPGKRLTRHVISVAQMLMSGLLIHLTQGRIETHFHVFGSLAFLSFYRDWRVLITASAVTAVDHFVRGFAWPLSIYGVALYSPWRWLEHTGWVIFEDIFLALAGIQSNRETNAIAERQTQLEAVNSALDRAVEERTATLRKTEERFELAVRGSTDGLWDWNVLTNEVYYSPRMKELIGYSDEEFPNVFASFESRLHPDDHDWVLRAVDEHLHHRTPYDVKYRLATKSGEYRWYRARGQALWNDAGIAQRMAGSITDVTEEHLLRERFRLAVEASPAALMMVDRNGRILMANSRIQSYFGYTAAEMIGQPVEILIPERFRPSHAELVREFVETPASKPVANRRELVAVRKDGSEFPVKVGLSPVETADGRAVICGLLDITDEKAMVEALQQAKETAESANRAKSSFLANMSHEIRTPMNGIIGMSQLLAQTELRSHQRDYLATIEDSAHILLRLLNDILDLSKIEAGKLELECTDFSLSQCVAHSSQMLVLRAAEKGLEIACRIAPEIPDYLLGDPGRIQQVLINLLGNAVKFTEAGEIFLNVNAESIMPDRCRLHFSVSDTGIGIPVEKQDMIFRPFAQAESSTTRRFGGSGLGLTISRQLVEMMHGRMWVESEPGRGSTFHFTAEFGVAPDQHQHKPAEIESLYDLPVLVVDDNFTNRRILCEMLQCWHMHPVSADSATAAREALKVAADSLHPIRLILLDHHMPGEDGFHFVENLRSQRLGEQCPIIMISSGSSPVDADLCQKHGISRLMTKPVIGSELLNEVLRQFGRYAKAEQAAIDTSGAAAHAEPRRVLLVEDNEINRRVAVGLLRSRGHLVTTAVNGQEAVNMLAEQEFDVVLMDMQMPVMDGYEATAVIRDRDRQFGGHTPVVAMTAEALKGDRERCLAVGMDDYVSKPIVPAELYRAVEQFPALCLHTDAWLHTSSDRNATDTEIPAADPVVKAPCESQGPVETGSASVNGGMPSVIDWNVAREHFGGGIEILREFAELVQSQTPKLLAEVRRAIETRDSNLLRRSAHTLKGDAAYFGAQSLMESALALELLGSSESFDGSAELLTKLEQDLVQVLAALKAGPPETVA